MACICGKGESLETCCGPVLAGTAFAPTAEALMRARYTAYATCNVDFIVESHDPDRRSEVDRKSTQAWSERSEWLGLEILATEQGGATDEAGTVEFVARYRIKTVTVKHHELATFRKVDGRWYFVDGKDLGPVLEPPAGPRAGRNEPCPCGSGKKYKKCHGSAAGA